MQDSAFQGCQLSTWRLDRIEEMRGPACASATMFPEWHAEVLHGRGWLVPDHVDAGGFYVAVIGGWLLRGHGRTVLLDTGAGAGKCRPSHPRYNRLDSSFLPQLAILGIQPGEVDTVVLSHLHVDHAGGCTVASAVDWCPAFPTARYVVGRTELDDFSRKAGAVAPKSDDKLIFDDSLAPLLATGLLDTVALPAAIAPGLTLEAAPGHTLGYAMLRLRSAGTEALFTFDVAHSVLQVLKPEWNTVFCEHPAAARATRYRVLEEAAARGLLLFPTHFGHAGPFRVHAAGEGFRPEFVLAAMNAA